MIRWETEAPSDPPHPMGGIGTVAAGSGASPTSIDIAGHARIVEDFVAAIREGREPLISGTEGRRSLELVLDIYRAAGLGPAGEEYP